MYEQLLNGDENAINALWQLLLNYSYAEWPTHKTVDFFRDDYINTAIYKILDNLESFRGDSKFSSWAISIFKNVVLDEIRYKRGNTTYNTEEYEGVGYIKVNDAAILVDQLFNLVVPDIVSEENFHILVDYISLERTVEEVCTDYNLSNPNALYARVFRTKKKIAEAVGNQF